jgi:hypothetical protein
MKEFFKTIIYGLDIILESIVSVESIVAGILLLNLMAKRNGYMVALFFFGGIACLGIGVFLFWELGVQKKNWIGRKK